MSPWVSISFLQTQSDARLLLAARQGHERAFEALIKRYRRQLLRYSEQLVRPQARAEDVLQQALLKSWVALRNGAEVRDARPWLFRVVHNSALDMVRRSGEESVELSERLTATGGPVAELDEKIAVRDTLVGLAALPELQREALLRTAVDGSSHEDVATALGISEGALRGLVYRARTTLRTTMTALTPPQLFSWVSSAGRSGAVLSDRLATLGGGGSVGLAGLPIKGGTAAVLATAVVAGASSLHHPRATHTGKRAPIARTAPARRASASRHPLATRPARVLIAHPSPAAHHKPGAPQADIQPGLASQSDAGQGAPDGVQGSLTQGAGAPPTQEQTPNQPNNQAQTPAPQNTTAAVPTVTTPRAATNPTTPAQPAATTPPSNASNTTTTPPPANAQPAAPRPPAAQSQATGNPTQTPPPARGASGAAGPPQ